MEANSLPFLCYNIIEPHYMTMPHEELTTIEEQLDHLLGELDDGPGSTKDKLLYARTVVSNVLVYIDSLYPESFADLHLGEDDTEHCEEGYV